jgi:hypothetical protein
MQMTIMSLKSDRVGRELGKDKRRLLAFFHGTLQIRQLENAMTDCYRLEQESVSIMI